LPIRVAPGVAKAAREAAAADSPADLLRLATFRRDGAMARQLRHLERHRSGRVGWLRAAVLGANDGIVSTASLIVGVAAAEVGRSEVLLSGVAGLVAGALSMAAGEYVSVSSQADTERADLDREREELASSPASEREELAQIYVARGLDVGLARNVAEQLMAHDALKSHARDELGITEAARARPIQAALASAASFVAGAVFPLAIVPPCPRGSLVPVVFAASLLLLVALGIVGARIGEASLVKGALRVGFWGSVAMASTILIGRLFGAAVR
jgi:VIT1/CCC1 family predicted Fe2+/Mn2+ transporter